MTVTPLIASHYVLERFQAKGGWTYAYIPEIAPDSGVAFGWIRVTGTIDGIDLGLTRLMPMGQGRLFLPIKAALRKKLCKKEGDRVYIVLFRDTTAVSIPETLQACLDDEPAALEAFLALPESRQKTIITAVNAATSPAHQTKKIVETLESLLKQQ
ncbi:YdeI/OmpD-associated family protein [Chitinophaga pollutisoli]|uniref:YdeI/OmpD-associated family protein n=1 Tax=Chitinophaga pollutisoli TaxID=3133966 RepID=A0ABZ2YUG0_9BACT